MKKIWMILSALAIANIFAIAALLAWLQTSHRLNGDRVKAIRAVLSTTIAQEDQLKADAAIKAVALDKQAVDAARQAVPPVTAAERIAESQVEAEKQLQSTLRQKQELQSLRDGLLRQMADLEQREHRLAADRSAFDAERARIAETDGSRQFQTALTTLEGQKPKDARSVLKALLDSRQSDQVVAYLSKMDESKRTKVLAEFVKDEPAVAADLLEKLRTRGQTGGVPPAPAAPMKPAPSAGHDPLSPAPSLPSTR